MPEKKKFEQEYLVKSSPSILFNRLSSPSGLAEWFADDVNAKDDIFTFEWDGSEEIAKRVGIKTDEFIRFQWEYDEEDGNEYYFEFRVKVDPLTKEVALIVTDFAEDDEIEETRLLWDTQVEDLFKLLGS